MSDETLASTRAERTRARSEERRRQRKAETRRAILEAATGLFLEHGYERFSLRQVAEAIGYSPTSIYLYFEDKDDLLFHAALEGFRVFGERLQAAYESSSDPARRLSALGSAYVEFGLAHPIHYRLMFMQRGEFLDRKPPEDHAPVIDSFGLLLRTVSEGLEAGRFKPGDARTYAGMIWAAVHGIVALAISTSYIDDDAARAMKNQLDSALEGGIMTRV